HEHEPGLAVEFSERFPTADGRGRLVPAHYHPGPEQADEQFPLLLATGRLLEHWHTGAMTRRAAVLDALAPQAEIAVHPHDAQRLCLSAGSLATITTRHGQIEAWVHISDAVQPGQLFLPFAYWEAAANRLTGAALDPVGKIPGFKVTAARIAPSVGVQAEDVDGAARAAA
ncbi:MAG: formate dehydrogenase subunit alpha, partial [Burkholderiales bacterium]|nr:formate dehydrogenase subunit alpha [Burkholderiales bacterium]